MKPALYTGAISLLIIGALLLQIANQRTTIVERDTKITRLEGVIETYRDATDKLKLTGELESSQAAGRATVVLRDGERLLRNLPKGTGPKAMNEFMGMFP